MSDAPAKSAASAAAAAARQLDLILVVIAVPVALALGAPTLGCLLGAGGWLVQRVLAQLDRRWISVSVKPRTQLGLNLAEAFGRIWLLAGAIVLAGVLGGRADGLAAALVICGAYSVAFAIRVLSGPPSHRRAGVSPSPSASARPSAAGAAVHSGSEADAIRREVAR
jgi:hypothetical protein